MKPHPSFAAWFARHATELDALVLDIDGVLCLNHRPLPGAAALVRALRRSSFPFLLLTNDGNHSKKQKRAFLRACGVRVNEAEIVSCADGLIELAAARGLRGRLFFGVGELGTPCYARKAGLDLTRRLERLPDCAGVIVGEKSYDWEPTINAVVNHFIARPSSLLIVPNPDEYYAVGPTTIELAAGSVARSVQRAAAAYGVPLRPIYLGKPFRPIFRHAHMELERRLGRRVPPGRVTMVGDSLASDIRGAHRFGYRSALILTGVTSRAMLASNRLPLAGVFERL